MRRMLSRRNTLDRSWKGHSMTHKERRAAWELFGFGPVGRGGYTGVALVLSLGLLW